MIEGKLWIKIAFARDLYPVDGETSDPYCYIIYPDGEYL